MAFRIAHHLVEYEHKHMAESNIQNLAKEHNNQELLVAALTGKITQLSTKNSKSAI